MSESMPEYDTETKEYTGYIQIIAVYNTVVPREHIDLIYRYLMGLTEPAFRLSPLVAAGLLALVMAVLMLVLL